jgi:hypothetical protein
LRVAQHWWPERLTCLIVGESPGRPGADYFYDRIPSERPDPVVVRGNLLLGLSEVGLLAAPTLEAFRDAGFAFDHAIRCQLPMSVISVERELAAMYESPKAAAADHLKPLIDVAPNVWAMGNLARNAVVIPYPDVPRHRGSITKEPFPGGLPGMPKVFVSRYLSHIDFDEVLRIAGRFVLFFRN